MPLALALMHFPVYNKFRHVVASSLTNLDIHDIARAATTYGAGPYFIVHAVPEMREFAAEVIGHWTEGFGAEYNVTRKEALAEVELAPDLDVVERRLTELWGRPPRFAVTSAKRHPFSLDYPELRRRLEEDDEPVCLLFGTGYGLVEEIVAEADYVLKPLEGPTDWNHLSVRSAVSIILDRLRGLPAPGA